MLLWQVDKRYSAPGYLRQRSVPFFERSQLQDLRVGLESVGFDGHCFGFPPSFRNIVVRLELDLFELVPGRKRLLLRRYLGFDRIVEVFGEFEINDVELIDEDVPILKPDL